jgi:hypothetical protein
MLLQQRETLTATCSNGERSSQVLTIAARKFPHGYICIVVTAKGPHRSLLLQQLKIITGTC